MEDMNLYDNTETGDYFDDSIYSESEHSEQSNTREAEIDKNLMKMSKVKDLLRFAIKENASDVHINTNRESSVRIKGVIHKTDIEIDESGLLLFCTIYSDCENDRFFDYQSKRRYSVDAAIKFEHRRFRLHIYRTSNNTCAVLRLLSEKVPELSNLNLPQSVGRFISANSGLILVCGATGSGKTTTIASIIDQINKTRDDVIITIEDPIEYVYTESRATIEQREVGTHVESFTQATVDALREDPDIIVVGEMRDLETIKNAITLAETGHLVFGTLHTKSAIDAIDRMVDIFPPEQQQQIRVQLASVLFGIVHQQLIKSSGNVVALCEVVMVDTVIANVIKQPNKSQASTLKDYIRNKKDLGCVHIVDNALWHIKAGRLKPDDIKFNLSEEDFRFLMARLK